jgi:hypothetical protein
MPALRRIAHHIRAEFVGAALLQIALIILWLATRPHTFDGVTAGPVATNQAGARPSRRAGHGALLGAYGAFADRGPA